MIEEKATDLGRLLGQSDEYRALLRARQHIEETPELKERLGRLQALLESMHRAVQEGREPSEDEAKEYERLLGEIQGDPQYQSLVAAESNFEKLMHRVNQQISEGLKKGAASPIITLS